MSGLAEFRTAKDAFFRNDPQSPLTPEQHRSFTGLAYFDEQPSLALELRPEPFEQPERIEMQTSTGEVASYERWARADFEVDGVPASITIYREPHGGALFVPFRDATSGGESYGAGRYLEPEEAEGGRVILDFNYAYNPYCAYNERWSCPLPPAENRLPVPIRAGERSFPG
ncbi:MAG: DUF1684 domain-containing protein [Chloroflexi bacterium]|nr:DUF1684 domain-containing protein [Chloroflexota bacterium]